MRLPVTITVFVALSFALTCRAQQVSISQKNISLSKVFFYIQEQTGFSLLYDNKVIRKLKNIDVDIKNASIQSALDYCFKDVPLMYIITDRIIVIKEKEKTVNVVLQAFEGFVTNETGHSLEGASVFLSEINFGTVTDTSGHFNFKNVPQGNYTLTITFVGYKTLTRKVSVKSGNSLTKFKLIPQDNSLTKIEVTALGIARKSRGLTYSMQGISNGELTSVKSANFLNSLNGKVTGVQINRTSSGVGGSVRVVLRGDKSTRNSQPLYVIDGMPIVNPVGGPVAGLYNSAPDGGDILSTINPDDIESVNILKGAAASALYGSQGSNGVIIITTKKTKSGVSRIDFSTSVSFDKTMLLPKLQYTFGQTNTASFSNPGSEDSWGDKLSQQVNKNYLQDFFQTGITAIHSISVCNGNDKTANYFSYSNTTNKGILPTSTFNQHTFNIRQSSKYLNDRLCLDATFMGATQRVHNRLTPGIYFNPLTGLYTFPRGLDFSSYRQFEFFSQSRYLYAQNWWNINYDKDQQYGGWGGQDYHQNPYWILNRNPVDIRNRNLYASVSLKYHLGKMLYIQARGNADNYVSETERNVYATSQATVSSFNGGIRKSRSENMTYYADLLFSGEKNFNNKYTVNYTVGASIQDQRGKNLYITGAPSMPNVFIESAIDRNNSSYDIKNGAVSRQIQSVFGTVQLGIQNKFFVDIADRNDWSSTLAYTPTVQRGYNYYSIGVSAVVTDCIKMPSFINYAKLRTSYAIVGNDIAPFSTHPLYTFSNGGVAQPPSTSPINIAGYHLRPEKNKSFEIGANVNLFKNKWSIDFTWYKSNIIDQYFRRVAVPPGLGTGGFADINAGNIQNKGFEFSVSGKIITRRSFGWSTMLNISANRNKIIDLFNTNIVVNSSSDQYYILYEGTDNFEGVIKKGGSYGDLYGRVIERDSAGFIVVNNQTGIPYMKDNAYLGNPNPACIVGWKNIFTYKRITFSFLVDGKFGGIVLSKTNGYLDQMGVSQRSAENDRTIKIINAIDQHGIVWNGMVSSKDFFRAIGGKGPLDEYYTYSATAVRLREVYLAYKKEINNKVVKEISFGITGSNLLFFYLKAPFDPEQVSGVNPNGVGVDTFGLPAYKSFGIFFKCTL